MILIDLMFVLWGIVTLGAAILTCRSVRRGQSTMPWLLLGGVALFYLISDAVVIGGFQLDGVTSFPVFAGIGASLAWLIIWGISVAIGWRLYDHNDLQ